MAKPRGKPKAGRPAPARELPSELDDDIERHYKALGRSKLPLDPDDDGDDDDLESEEEAVLNLSDEADSSGDEDEEESGEDAGRLGKLKKQEKLLRAKLQLQQGEDVSEDSGQEEERGGQLWGARRRDYYGENEEDDEEAMQEEEQEARRLQRQAAEELRPGDYEQGIESSDDLAAQAPETLGAAADATESCGVEVEAVEKRVDALSAAERRAAVLADAPELEALLADLQASLQDVRTRTGPLLREVREGSLATAQGISYLEAKNLLLLQYCMHLVFYVLLKAEGRPVASHPVIGRLVEIRTFLEKTRPIDKRLQYQMDKLLAAAAAAQASGAPGPGADGSADALQYRPNPDALVARTGAAGTGLGGAGGAGGERAGADGAGLYRPPRIAPTMMEDDPDRDGGRKARRRDLERARRAARSTLLPDLAAELAGAPEELVEVPAGGEAAGLARARERLAVRAAEEEELMTRVPLRKGERKALKARWRAGMAGGALLDDFADEVADLVQGGPEPGEAAFPGGRAAQRFAADLAGPGRASVRGGDEDMPMRPPLPERRAALDSVRARQAAAMVPQGDDDDGPPTQLGSGKRRRKAADSNDDISSGNEEEEQLYLTAARAATGKKKARKDKYTAPPLAPPLADELAEGPRELSRAVAKNRGLTPHRRKDIKNPRVKGRKRFDSAQKRRRGQVVDVRQPHASYSGEATGIKAKVSKSRRFD